MTSSSPVESASFYETRYIAPPTEELRPDSAQQLCAAIDEAEGAQKDWSIVGDGQHVAGSRREGQWSAIRTDGLDDLVELDKKSGLVRVQAGIRWRDLQEKLLARGFSTQRYGLHPASATVGGMLARRRPGPPLLRGGELLDGCVAIGAHSPQLGEYRYLVAPRKASGPDLRHEFIGTGGGQGAIVDATLVVWRPVAERLLRYRNCSLAEARDIVAALYGAEITPSCLYYSHRGQSLQLILSAPGQLLRSRVKWLGDHLRSPDESGDADEARTRRAWLEARHPDRRAAPGADRTRAYWLTSSAFDHNSDELFGHGVEEIEITSWTLRRAVAFVRYETRDQALTTHQPPRRTCWAHWPLVQQ